MQLVVLPYSGACITRVLCGKSDHFSAGSVNSQPKSTELVGVDFDLGVGKSLSAGLWPVGNPAHLVCDLACYTKLPACGWMLSLRMTAPWVRDVTRVTCVRCVR